MFLKCMFVIIKIVGIVQNCTIHLIPCDCSIVNARTVRVCQCILCSKAERLKHPTILYSHLYFSIPIMNLRSNQSINSVL